MQIQHAHVKHLQVPIAHPVKTAFGALTARHAVLLILEDEKGHRGVGESWVNFPAWAPWERVAAFEHALLPWLQGRALDDVPAASGQMYRAFLGPAQQSGTVEPLLGALCAVELALWDLAAQRQGLPLARLLFPDPRPRVRVYASGINSPLPWELLDQHLACGVTLFKLKLGFGDEEDRRNLEALRRHLDGRAQLAVDVNRGWSLAQAQAWWPRLRDYGVQWVEEPLRVEEEDKLPLLRGQGLTLAGGENVLMPPGSNPARLAETPADVLQPDLTKYAPLHVARALIAPATARGQRLVPHFLGSAPGQAASLHFAAGCPEGLLEWDINTNPLRTELYTEPFRIVEGGVALPDAPGLGWVLR